MTQLTRQAIIDRDFENKYGVFAEIMRRMIEIPPMPADLENYDKPISGREAWQEAERVLQLWQGQSAARSMNTDVRLPCTDVELAPIFFPEWPVPEDYAAEGRFVEVQVAQATAEIDMARAKQVCSECPMRLQCLAKALEQDIVHARRGEDRLVHGVFGGWGPSARLLISNRLVELLRVSMRQTKELKAS